MLRKLNKFTSLVVMGLEGMDGLSVWFKELNSTEMHLKSQEVFIGRYEYDWKREEAEKNVLRTHTTAVSSRMLYKLAQVIVIKNIVHTLLVQLSLNVSFLLFLLLVNRKNPSPPRDIFQLIVSFEMKQLTELILQSFTRLKVSFL